MPGLAASLNGRCACPVTTVLLLSLLLAFLTSWVAPSQSSRLIRAEIRPASATTSPKFTSISVIGQRHSGTNYMKRLIAVNVPTHMDVNDIFCDFKHNYQAEGKDCPPLDSTIVVVMVRNPYDWALAMHRKCWCGDVEAVRMSNMDFKEFVEQPWLDDSLKPWNPMRNATINKNIFHSRALKLLNFLNISNWAPNVEYVRHEDVITPKQAKKWMAAFLDKYSFPTPKIQPVKEYKDWNTREFDASQAKRHSVWFNRTMVSKNTTLQKQMLVVTNVMDLAVESMVGYFPLAV